MKTTIVIILVLAFVSCTTKLYIPSEANVNKRETASLIELQQGKEIFSSKCGRCHKLPKPENRQPQEWTKILEKMAPKAKLTADQKALVFKYISNY
ncbi:MAG: c-type cytochrome [Bacteroidales bacterium]